MFYSRNICLPYQYAQFLNIFISVHEILELIFVVTEINAWISATDAHNVLRLLLSM